MAFRCGITTSLKKATCTQRYALIMICERRGNHRNIIPGTALIRWKSYGDYNDIMGNIGNKNWDHLPALGLRAPISVVVDIPQNKVCDTRMGIFELIDHGVPRVPPPLIYLAKHLVLNHQT